MDQKYPKKHANANTINAILKSRDQPKTFEGYARDTYEAENSIITGVTNPIKTGDISTCLATAESRCHFEEVYVQLLNQFDAVASDTPLLRTDCGKTSLGRIHPMGP